MEQEPVEDPGFLDTHTKQGCSFSSAHSDVMLQHTVAEVTLITDHSGNDKNLPRCHMSQEFLNHILAQGAIFLASMDLIMLNQ